MTPYPLAARRQAARLSICRSSLQKSLPPPIDKLIGGGQEKRTMPWRSPARVHSFWDDSCLGPDFQSFLLPTRRRCLVISLLLPSLAFIGQQPEAVELTAGSPQMRERLDARRGVEEMDLLKDDVEPRSRSRSFSHVADFLFVRPCSLVSARRLILRPSPGDQVG